MLIVDADIKGYFDIMSHDYLMFNGSGKIFSR
jgi:hypothetical protein